MSYNSALKKLDEVIVGGGGAATIAFSSIDQRFRHLMLVLTARSDQSSNPTIGLTFNGDTGANYDYHKTVFSGIGSTGGAESYGATSILCGDLLGTGLATTPGGHRMWIYNYVDTNWHKVMRSDEDFKYQNSTPGALSVIYSGWWRSTSAITSLTLTASSGLIVQYSVASLYGVV